MSLVANNGLIGKSLLCLSFGVMLCTSTASGQGTDENKAVAEAAAYSVGTASQRAAAGMEMRQVDVRPALDMSSLNDVHHGVESSSDGSAVNVAFPGVVNRQPVAVNRVAVPVPILIPVPVP
ncbi:MAG TPA: hypothetical protein PKZ32_21505, partial [Candidatus Melainabacteria bacterium]|nr:hypothetical protein [Candidatus Melainabacteria bacterium]